jgi:hypothetical protein
LKRRRRSTCEADGEVARPRGGRTGERDCSLSWDGMGCGAVGGDGAVNRKEVEKRRPPASQCGYGDDARRVRVRVVGALP